MGPAKIALFEGGGSSHSREVQFRAFPKKGNPRWLLEESYETPWHLKTWPRSNLRAQFAYYLILGLSKFGWHLPHRKLTISVGNSSLYAKIRSEWQDVGVFLGSPGPNRKLVVYAGRSDRSVFIKIPLDHVSAQLVKREHEALQELNEDPVLRSLVPRFDIVAEHLAVENVATEGVRYAPLAITEVERIHNLLECRSAEYVEISDLKREWIYHGPALSGANENGAFDLLRLNRKIAFRFLDSIAQGQLIHCYKAHGDFTRWNVLKAADGTGRILDWEFFGRKPRWFDLVHYVVSHDLLVRRLEATQIVEHLEAINRMLQTKVAKDEWWRYVGLYFAYQSLYYSGIYETQKELHAQAWWQLVAWKDVLTLISNMQDK